MRRLKGTGRPSIARPRVDPRLRHERLLLLEDEAARQHLTRLAVMLEHMPALADLEIPWISDHFTSFVRRLHDTVEAILLKHRVEAGEPNADIKLSISINGVESGFPVFARDLEYLDRDRRRAAKELRALAAPEELVNLALEYLFRETYPEREIQQMVRRRYFETISRLDLPLPGPRCRSAIHAGDQGTASLYLKTVERMDERNNLPRFYVIYLRTTLRDFPPARWEELVDAAVAQGLGHLSDAELPHVAQAVEEIDGLVVEAVDRYDIGPFYSIHTVNEDFVGELLDGAADEDVILMFRRHRVQRAGQRRLPGLRRWLRALTSGDVHRGHFTATVASPLYTLLPHRLIQKAHHDRIRVPQHVALKAVAQPGAFLE